MKPAFRAPVLAAISLGLGIWFSQGCGGGFGGCKYESFDGQCNLAKVYPEGSASAGMITLLAEYYPESKNAKGFQSARVSTTVAASKEAAVREHFEKYKQAHCKGSVIVQGTCSPGKLDVDVPAFKLHCIQSR